MPSGYLLHVLNNLCNMFMDDGTVSEEVIEMMLDAGANVAVLKSIGFTDVDINNYVYYASMMSGRSEEDISNELYAEEK